MAKNSATASRNASEIPHAINASREMLSDRLAAGRAIRGTVPRSAHSSWSPSAERSDPLSLLQATDSARLPELLPIRYGRMLDSPFAFFRGAAAIMASDLATTPSSGITVQVCGDAHLLNFGAFASPERNLVFDLNDFDETLPGPWEWDVKRLAASVLVAGRANAFPFCVCRRSVCCGTRVQPAYGCVRSHALPGCVVHQPGCASSAQYPIGSDTHGRGAWVQAGQPARPLACLQKTDWGGGWPRAHR